MSTDVQKYETTVKRDEKQKAILKLTQQIQEMEQEKLRQKQEGTKDDDFV